MKHMQRAMTRHAFLQEAAFRIVLRQGCHALTRRALAVELGLSDSRVRHLLDPDVALAQLAAAQCEERRRRARQLRRNPPSRADWVVDQLVPSADEVDVEVVWLRLVAAYGLVEVASSSDDLAERFEIADGRVPGGVTPTAPPREDRAAVVIAARLEQWRASARGLIGTIVDDADQVAEVETVVDGLLTGVCTGRLGADVARSVLLADLLRRAGEEAP